MQANGATITPSVTLSYDAHGNVLCYANGTASGQSIVYNSLSRPTTMTDADDGAGFCGSVTSTNDIKEYVTYNADASISKTETSAQHATGTGTIYAYDLDGNLTATTHHFGGAAGTEQRWYDGDDRLVETMEPTASGESAWLTRYLYDLTQGGTAVAESVSATAHGNLFAIQHSTDSHGVLTIRASSFDAADRPTSRTAFLPCPAGTTAGEVSCNPTSLVTNLAYDASGFLGKLTSQTAPNGRVETLAYDGEGRLSTIQYTSDPATTPSRGFLYDPSAHIAQVTDGKLGAYTYTYNDDGFLVQSKEPGGAGAQLDIGVYPNGQRKSLSVTAPDLTQANLFAYSYQSDGHLRQLDVSHQTMRPVAGSATGPNGSITDSATKYSEKCATGNDPPAPQFYTAYFTTYSGGGTLTSSMPTGTLAPNQAARALTLSFTAALPSGQRATAKLYRPDGTVFNSYSVANGSNTLSAWASTESQTGAWRWEIDFPGGSGDADPGCGASQLVTQTAPTLTISAANMGYTLPSTVNGFSLSAAYTSGGRLTSLSDSVLGGASKTVTYDSNGRPSAIAIPAGAYSAMTYDSEDELTSYQAFGGETVTQSFSLRGELLTESYSPNAPDANGNTPYPSFTLLSDQGVLHTSGDEWDARTGDILEHAGSTYTYDNLGRMSTNGASYDAEDHILQMSAPSRTCDGTSTSRGGLTGASYTWDALGHPVSVTKSANASQYGRSLHWDGDTLLYQTVGTLNPSADLQVGDVAEWPNLADGSTFTVTDRDGWGGAVSGHNWTGTAAWAPADPFGQMCSDGGGVSASAGYTAPLTGIVTPFTGVLYDGVSEISGGQSYDAFSRSMMTSGSSSARAVLGDCTQQVPFGRSTLDLTCIGHTQTWGPAPFTTGGGGSGYGFSVPIWDRDPKVPKNPRQPAPQKPPRQPGPLAPPHCFPGDLVSAGMSVPMISVAGLLGFSGTGEFTATRLGTVFFSPGLSLGVGLPTGGQVLYAKAYPAPGKTVDDIMSGMSFGAILVLPNSAFGVVRNASGSTNYNGGGVPYAGFITSYGFPIDTADPSVKALFCQK